MPTYFDRQKERTREQERRDALATWCAETLAIERMAEDWRRQMARKGWTPLFRPQPRPLRRGSIAKHLRTVEAIARAILPEPWSPFLPWTHKVDKKRPACAWDLFYVGEADSAWREYRRRRGWRFRDRVKHDRRLARKVRGVFVQRRAGTRGGGTRAPRQTVRALILALAVAEIGVDRTAITRAPERLMRAMGHTPSLDKRPK